MTEPNNKRGWWHGLKIINYKSWWHGVNHAKLTRPPWFNGYATLMPWLFDSYVTVMSQLFECYLTVIWQITVKLSSLAWVRDRVTVRVTVTFRVRVTVRVRVTLTVGVRVRITVDLGVGLGRYGLHFWGQIVTSLCNVPQRACTIFFLRHSGIP